MRGQLGPGGLVGLGRGRGAGVGDMKYAASA
jgi:hypothetical protein